MRISLCTSIALGIAGVLSASGGASSQTASGWTFQMQPAHIVNGSAILFQVTTPKTVSRLSGSWLGHELAFSFDLHQKCWMALAGAALETKPGDYSLQIHAETSAGRAMMHEQRVRIHQQRYPRVILTVPGKYTAPSPEDLRQIEQDKVIKGKAFQTTTPEREWRGAFARPAQAEISGIFGVQRVFNGSVQSTHQGLDFRVPTGTPVSAVNSGRVILAQPLFFEGNCVVIDHGQGLLTLYLHLSKIEVKEGDVVRTGQQIGLSGGTGRATGPHLHLAVRWQGVYLDPATLLSIRIPG